MRGSGISLLAARHDDDDDDHKQFNETTVIYLPYLPTHSAQAGYDTMSIFKRSLTGLNSEFSYS